MLTVLIIISHCYPVLSPILFIWLPVHYHNWPTFLLEFFPCGCMPLLSLNICLVISVTETYLCPALSIFYVTVECCTILNSAHRNGKPNHFNNSYLMESNNLDQDELLSHIFGTSKVPERETQIPRNLPQWSLSNLGQKCTTETAI